MKHKLDNKTFTCRAIKFTHQKSQEVQDTLTTEKLLQIMVNGKPFTMTMRTPGDDLELTRGLLHVEQVTEQLGSFRYSTQCIDEEGDVSVVNVELKPNECGSGLKKERNIVSSSSCGICGQQDAEAINLVGNPIVSDVVLKPDTIWNCFQKMSQGQAVFQHSGGSHAAAIFNETEEMLSLKEDIGRHNAVDKCIGDLLIQNKLSHAALLLVSGRVSFEIIMKAYRGNIPFLAAISAPSSLAVQLAEEKGLTLIAFCRENKLTVYTHAHRIMN